jgi:hypothetical protein
MIIAIGSFILSPGLRPDEDFENKPSIVVYTGERLSLIPDLQLFEIQWVNDRFQVLVLDHEIGFQPNELCLPNLNF